MTALTLTIGKLALILRHMSLNIDSIVSILPNHIEPRLIHLFQFILWFSCKPTTLNRCIYRDRMRFKCLSLEECYVNRLYMEMVSAENALSLGWINIKPSGRLSDKNQSSTQILLFSKNYFDIKFMSYL